MLETRFRSGSAWVTRLSREARPAPEAVLLLPGFPGHAPPPDALERGGARLRVELSKAALSVADVDCYLPGYEGLESGPGAFRFGRALEASAALGRELAGRHARVHVCGHSFGGLVAFNVHRALGARGGRLALLSGLLDLAGEEDVEAFVRYCMTRFPDVLPCNAEAFRRSVADLDAVRRAGNPLSWARPMAEDELLLVHGRSDADVDVELSRRLHRKAGGRYVELDADHGYSGRLPDVAAEFRRFLAGVHSSPTTT